MTPAELTREAERLLALPVPFRHQGRTELGMDCAGFALWLVRYAGRWPVEFQDPANYRPGPQAVLLQTLQRFCTMSPATDGVLLAMRWHQHEPVSHVGYLAGDTLIHSYKTAGGLVRTRYGEPWVRMTVSAWRIPGVVYE
jgi:cell wall-associated NlpC family hydrolase